MLYIDLMKSITRAQAKAKHPKLPEGGIWRTIKGHHVYIKDGKVLAGAGVGKTGKPIKLTKQHLDTHQEHVDKEATKKKAPPKKATPKKQSTKTSATVNKKKTAVSKPVNKKTTTAKTTPKKTTTTAKKAAPKKPTPSSHYHIAQRNIKTSKHEYAPVEGAVHAPVKSKHEFFYHKEKSPSGKKTEHRISEATSGLLIARGTNKKQAHEYAQNIIDKFGDDKIAQKIAEHHKEIGVSPYAVGSHSSIKKAPKRKKSNSSVVKEPPLVLYHGTKLPVLSHVMEKGFSKNGHADDFGYAAYFKSPAYDHLDKNDHEKKIREMEKKGAKVDESFRNLPGPDTKDVIEFFAFNKEPLVIEAAMPREHVLDCTNGRPQELQDIMDGYDAKVTGNYESRETRIKYITLKHLLGLNLKPQSEQPVADIHNLFEEHRTAITEKLGREIQRVSISPYEIYAAKHDIAAIVDKLPKYEFEGWQVGVYKTELLQVTNHGKKITYDKQGLPKLVKALLLKAMQEAAKNSNAYTLMGHKIDDNHLTLHVGVYDDQAQQVKKSHEITSEGARDAMKVFKASELNIVNASLEKSVKLSGGGWKTVHGQHVYIKDGTILTGKLKGKNISQLKGEKTNDKQQTKEKRKRRGTEGTSKRKPSSVGEKTSTNPRGTSEGPTRGGQSQNASRSGEHASPIRNISKQHIAARSEREYDFHRLEGKEGASAFYKAITAAKEGNDHGAFVHAYDEHEYDGMKMFLTEGGEAGFAVKDNGDICSVFHNTKIGQKKGVLGHCMELSLQHGGNRLDCFDGFLPKQYAKWGFEPVAKVKFNREYAPEGWNFERDGEPDVLFFAHNGDNLQKVLETNYPLPDLAKTPLIEDYDDGAVHQDAYLEGRNGPIAKSLSMHLEVMESISLEF